MFGDLKEKLASKKASLDGAELGGGLKDKLAGLDKKRLYTAVTALIIAGAAGHIMQRGDNPADQVDPHLAASEFPAPAAATMGLAPPQRSASIAPAEAPSPNAVPDAPQADPTALAEAVPATEPTALPAAALAQPEIVAADTPLTEPLGMDPAPEVTRSANDPMPALTDAAPAPLDLEPIVEAAPMPDLPIELAAISEPDQTVAAPAAPVVEAPMADACDVTFSATPLPAALVALSLDAPCNSGEPIEFEHYGLRFSEQLGPEGQLDMQVPAMAANAIFVASFSDGASTSAATTVPDFADYDRVALVWKGATGLQLHALENGASYGDPGHLWAEAPGTASLATEGKGGFVSVLGSTATGYAADVYTYPDALMQDAGEPDVSIEAQVMENTCGSRIEGAYLHANQGQTPTLSPVTMALPGCDAVGEYLVLKNLPRELKLARN